MKDYIFILGREPELSFAELVSLFGTGVIRLGSFAFFSCDEEVVKKEVQCLGGTIKIGEIIGRDINKNELSLFCAEHIKKFVIEGKKLRVGIDSFVPSLSKVVFRVKDILKEEWASIRVVQHENWRIKTATTIHEKLITQGVELIIIPDKNGFCVAETTWIQDIEAYSERDINRDRSMIVGMMPPKLAQMMINFASQWDKSHVIWDPFCGLWTTLIEAFHGWYTHLLWSDISADMVLSTRKNIEKITQWTHTSFEVFSHDAQKINEKEAPSKTALVTEGMLGKNFSSTTINHASVLQERRHLTELYRHFFESSFKNKNIQKIVCCMPFWNIGKETIYMPLFEDFSVPWKVDPLCRSGKRYLIHMRPGQYVGREILILRRT